MIARQERKAGMTLLELLVVIAIIGLLLGLLLPAVQFSVEAARRASCQNKLRQIGLALQTYHDAHRRFPIGNVPDRYWTFQSMLLPYMEQGGLYERLDYAYPKTCMELEYERIFRVSGRSDAFGMAKVPIMYCPSDKNAGKMSNSKFLYEPFLWCTCGDYVGVMGTRSEGPLYDGLLYQDSRASMASAVDGLADTMIVGERGILESGSWGWFICAPGKSHDGFGDNLLSTEFGFRPGDDDDPEAYQWFWSNHPGGGNFVMADGSLHFVQYEIDPKTFQALSTCAGHEILGNW